MKISSMQHHFILTMAQIIWVLAILLPFNLMAQKPEKSTAAKSHKPVPTVRFDSGSNALKIPLEINNNIILLRVSVNNSKPLKFIFDTAASVSIINSRQATELGLKPKEQVTGNATGGKFQASLIEGVSLGVQGAEVSDQLIASATLPAPPGFEYDGIIGYDFIKEFVVEIDYQNKIMNLYNPRTYAYSGKGEVIPLLLAGRRTPLIRTRITFAGRTATVIANLEVDTGADGTIVINNPFFRKYKLLATLTKTAQASGVGAGGEEKRLVSRVKTVRLGKLIISNPPVAFSIDAEESGEGENNNGIIGGEIFRRFKVILDYYHKQMILEPNKGFGEPYEIETDG
ncbi:MAG TPA: aspartyl protease family protein [Pyrinomonadaceae bacterium]|nr:aspartyl protease family protein [Pyrinomonadaceae bacterium]